LKNPNGRKTTKPSLTESWKLRAQQLKSELYALYLAYKDPRLPWYARVIAALVIGYAFSPIDLIPDPIPILGYLDDIILVPLGIWLAIKLIPTDVMNESRIQAKKELAISKPVNQVAAVVIVIIWLVLAGVLLIWGIRVVSSISNFGTSLRLASGRI